MYDVILRGGTVVDGTGRPGYVADVAISDGEIAAIGRLQNERAGRELDVRGLVVTPGFIDAHSHSGLALLAHPGAESKVHQGVTTEVIGNCGSSPAPAGDDTEPHLLRVLSDAGIGDSDRWTTQAEYNDVVARRGISLNIAPLVGHGSVRAFVMGFDARQPNEEELSRMQDAVRKTMEAGAVGLSTGLIYAPGSYASTGEVEALAHVVGRYGGVYTSHLRSEADGLEEAVAEALHVGKVAGVPTLISHHKAAGQRNWGKTRRTLRQLEDARNEGRVVACDVYPYLAGSTSLSALLPGWSHDGGHRAMLERLQNPDARARIAREFQTGLPGWENLAGLAGWENIMITSAGENNSDVPGKTVAELAALCDSEPATVVFDLLVEEDGNVGMVLFMMDEADLQRVLAHPWTMIGSDAGVQSSDEASNAKPHPRAFGTFPRIYARYVRELGLIELEEAVRKMTSLPAEFFGLQRRGRLVPGYIADITVFDAEAIADTATYTAPLQLPTGIPYVFVKGEPVVYEEKHTGARPGSVLGRR